MKAKNKLLLLLSSAFILNNVYAKDDEPKNEHKIEVVQAKEIKDPINKAMASFFNADLMQFESMTVKIDNDIYLCVGTGGGIKCSKQKVIK